MKHYSVSFNKKSRLIKHPEAIQPNSTGLHPLQPEHLQARLNDLLQIQNDFFPCFDWTFPPPLFAQSSGPQSIAELFAQPSVIPHRYSVYLHVPFCKTLCSFCYYTVLPGRGIEQSATYVDYLLREMAMYHAPLIGSALRIDLYRRRHAHHARQRASDASVRGAAPALRSRRRRRDHHRSGARHPAARQDRAVEATRRHALELWHPDTGRATAGDHEPFLLG